VGLKLGDGDRNRAFELVSGVEVPSCWVGGGGASAVGLGKTALACRTP